jgi:hypothetical protein
MGINIGITEAVLAIITMDKNMKSASYPVFYAENKEELENRALIISKTMGGMVHDALNGTLMIVKH